MNCGDLLNARGQSIHRTAQFTFTIFLSAAGSHTRIPTIFFDQRNPGVLIADGIFSAVSSCPPNSPSGRPIGSEKKDYWKL
jgi:hypothetical protein